MTDAFLLALDAELRRRAFPPFQLSADPIQIAVPGEERDLDLEVYLEEYEEHEPEDREAYVSETADDLQRWVDDPPEPFSFATAEARSVLDLAASLPPEMLAAQLTVSVAEGYQLEIPRGENDAWYQRKLGLPGPLENGALYRACIGWMWERCEKTLIGPRVWGVTGPYAPAVLSAPGALDALSLEGDPVAIALPDRVFLAGAEDEEALHFAATRALEALPAEGQGLFDAICLRHGPEGWTRWIPPRALPSARVLFIGVRRMAHSFAYDLQKQLLERQVDLFVASLMTPPGMQRTPLGPMTSVLTEGVATMLPRCELLCLVRDGAGVMVAPFQALMKECKDRISRVADESDHPVIPTRYVIDSFPTAEELERIARHPRQLDPLEWFEDR